MMISTFDLFSIGIGPSSSHTVGPMRAAKDFLIQQEKLLEKIASIEMTLYGSLAFTGEGHGTHMALLMGLEGEDPETINPDTTNARVEKIKEENSLNLLGKHNITFDFNKQLILNKKELLDYHSNGMTFKAFDKNKKMIASETYYSTGGGFIINDTQLKQILKKNIAKESVPFPFDSAEELLQLCKKNNCSIAEIVLENEKTWRDEKQIRQLILNIADAMEESLNKGCKTPGILPGGLNVNRRAPPLYDKLIKEDTPSPKSLQVMNWLNCYAMAVNEENAAGGRVVTAPTNGAAGTIPAILNYYKYFCDKPDEEGVMTLLLTAAAIGILYKKNASISGAEMGCQGEVGVACSMAAGALAAALGGSIFQVESAAEIGMEHNLGLTCDPIKGLVQIPCIERNAMAAVKAVNAAKLALAERGEHKVSLDAVINTMRETGNNMNRIYKETSEGGLAVNVPEC